jgi:hypothetical protein
LIGRGRFLVEDALRTASLPETDGGRLYFVRHLDLGVIDPERAPGAVAQRIEQRFAALRTIAVHAATPHAASSPVVYFNDALEPFIVLVRRIAAGTRPSAWFWAVAVPGYSPNLPYEQALRAAVSGALTTPGGGAAAAALMAALNDTEIDGLCHAMCEADARAWLSAFPLDHGDAPLALASSEPALSSPWQRVLERWARRWGEQDLRTRWLAVVAVCAHAPGNVARPGVMRRAARAIRALRLVSQPAPSDEGRGRARISPVSPARRRELYDASVRTEPTKPGSAASVAADAGGRHADTGAVASVAADAGGRRADAGAVGQGEPAAGSSELSVPLPVSVAISVPDQDSRELAPPHPSFEPPPASSDLAPPTGAGGQRVSLAPTETRQYAFLPLRSPRRVLWEGALLPTVAGGLLFLVRAFIRLGFPAWLEARPALWDSGFAVRLLCEVGILARIPPEDPSLALWGVEDHPELSLAERKVVCGWCLRLARWTRRFTGLSLGAVISRPAHIVATRTHVDVVFGHCDADVRIRAAGLDTDPGWVPWLGRVIQFHFTDMT